jgi:phosphoenolpyruvate carboxylase
MKHNKSASPEEHHLPLREDVRLLGDLLGVTIKDQAGHEVFEKVEQIRKLSKASMAGDLTATKQLIKLLQHLPGEQLLPITKAFSQFLNFANIAEQYHRIRRARSYKLNTTQGPQLGSLEEVIPNLKKLNVKPEAIYKAICDVDIQLVLTSHPTEIKRRTVMRKYDRISMDLQKLDTQILTPDEIDAVKDDIHSEMTAVWQTAEVRSQKPTAVDEAKWGFAIIESSLWHAVPMFMRELDRVVQHELGRELPLDLVSIRIDSWLGGDRDGNPNVTPEVTRHVAFMGRWVAADLLLNEITRLRDSLSMRPCNAKLHSIVGFSKEPYRDLLYQVLKKLKATKMWARDNFHQATPPSKPIYYDSRELLEALMLCYESLIECKAEIIAKGRLLDIIRQVQCFGMALVRMDIRQESSKHTELMSVITQQIGLGDYAQWDEAQRQAFLVRELEQQRPLIAKSIYDNPLVQDTARTFRLLAKLPRDGLGAYIISMSHAPSDVLAVALLQREFGIKKLLPVVPLFETRLDLGNSAKILETLLGYPVYRKLIDGYQQVMIGYSDSAKDVGILAASWAQYCAQEEMLKVANSYKVKLVFFHGRGGSLGRGGWPTHEAITSQPPGSVHGVMRVTQQGEVIQNRFGLRCIALRTFSVYTTSTLEACLCPPAEPQPEWRTLMHDLSRISAEKYKQTVADETDFIRYFQSATPTKELKKLAIGSRPDSRSNVDSLSKLRAIPWIFAWTQNRLLLPSWAGVGVALQYAFDTGRGTQLETMNAHWPFFRAMLSMCEMVFAKADVNVAKHYEERLVPKELFKLGESLREQFIEAKQVLLRVLGENLLLEHNPVLDRSIKLRNPYLLPLHLLQVELLYRVREDEAHMQDEVLQALLVSIAGIAAGMRNTG